MTQLRFGRKIPLPSTAEIKHEIRLMEAADALATLVAPEALNATLQDVADGLGFSDQRAHALIERFGTHTTAATARSE